MDKATLKRIRWFSNGVWQFQPHLYFFQNLNAGDEGQLSSLSEGQVVQVGGFKFKLETPDVGTVEKS